MNREHESFSDYAQSLDAVGIHIFNEFATRAIADKVVRPGDTVLDLGANEGFHTFHLSQIVGNEGIVHAFEPNPAHWQNLLSHQNIRLWPMAVGDTVSVETFYLPLEKNYHQVGSLIDPSDFLGTVDMRTLSVPQVTIDSLLEIDKNSISFIKMDIERREIFCMKGMIEVFAKSEPIIIFENNTPEIESFLNSIQYHVVGMVQGTSAAVLPNVIAVPDNKLSDINKFTINEEEVKSIKDIVIDMTK